MKKIMLITALITAVINIASVELSAKNTVLLVQPFHNTGDSKYSWISAGITDSVISDLSRLKSIGVVSDIDRKKALREITLGQTGLFSDETVTQAGKMTGANLIFSGSYLVSGLKIRVNARIINVATGKIEKSVKIDGTVDDIFGVQDKIVINLIEESGKITIENVKPVAIDSEEKKKLSTGYKPKNDVYEWYSKGLEVKDSDPKKALVFFKKAIEADPEYTAALIEAGNTAGEYLSLFDEATGFLKKAEKVFQKRGDTMSKGYAVLMMHFGTVSWSKRDLDPALEYFMKSRVIMEKLGLQNTGDYAKFMHETGAVYWAKGEFDRAHEYFLKSRETREKAGLQDTNSYAELMNDIGVLYHVKGELDSALEYYMKAKGIRDKLNLQNTNGYAVMLMNFGNLYEKKGQADLALEYYMKSRAIREVAGLENTADYALLMCTMADLYKSQGKKSQAGEYYKKSYKIYSKIGIKKQAEYVKKKIEELEHPPKK
jgi:TolB-like protein/tetratricopeptide (TPR) repeat protein